jgi:hypothetical protein
MLTMSDVRKTMSVHDILSERQKTHGDFTDVADIGHCLKEVMRTSKNWREDNLSASVMEGLDMIQHKIARVLSGNPLEEDHYKDIAGYAECILRTLRRP